MTEDTLNPRLAREIQTSLEEITGRSVGTITADLRLDDIGIDSVTRGELVLALEEGLGVFFSLEELKEVETFGQLQSLISSKTKL